MVDNRQIKLKKIVKNTVVLYVRSIINLVITLYSSRLILQVLGAEDYGIYNVVAGFVSMFWLVSGSLSSATCRFLNYEMGREDSAKMRRIFSLSLSILLVLGLVAVILTETFGVWFLDNKMSITPGREHIASIVFHLAVLELFMGFVIVPYNASIIAHEKFTIFAYLSIAESVFRLLIALVLSMRLPVDALLLYGILCTVSSLIVKLASVIYSMHSFSETKYELFFDKQLFKDIFDYSSWNFLGSISGVFSGQGVNMILNVKFGPIVNTARGLATSVNQSVALLVGNFSTSINPQITQSFSAHDYDFFKTLLFRGSKICFFLFYIFALPLILETPAVLAIWLGEASVPEHTVSFVRLALINHIFTLFKGVFPSGIIATGNVKHMFIIFSMLDLINFPASYLAIVCGGPPESVYLFSIGLLAIQCFCVLKLSSKQLNIPFNDILGRYLYRLFFVICASLPIPLLFLYLFPDSLFRLMSVIIASIVSVGFSSLYIGCTQNERTFIIEKAKCKILRY